MESSDDAIIGKTLDGTILTWNSGAERLYGHSAEEVKGRAISLLIPPDHPDELPEILRRLHQGERIDHYETVRVRKDGERVDVSLSISLIRDEAGLVVGASSIARDISERRRIGTTGGSRPAQGRVPGAPGTRTPQPPGPHPECHPGLAGLQPGRRRFEVGQGYHRTPGPAPDPVG